MPVVVAHIKLEWISGGWQPYAGRPVETDRSRVMREVVDQLQGIVVTVLNNHDGRSRTLEDVALRIEPIHSWSKDVPDLWVNVMPMEVDLSWAARKQRRFDLAREVSGSLFDYLDQAKFLAGPRPSYDVDCVPTSSSGISRDSDGVVTGAWGVPEGDPYPSPVADVSSVPLGQYGYRRIT